MEQENVMKTGTTTVGIVFKDGVILAADKRATAGHLIAQYDCKKVHKIADNMAVTMAGSASEAQYLINLITAEIKLRRMRTEQEPSVSESAHMLSRIVYGNIRRPSMLPGISHFILGGGDATGYYLYDIFPDGTISECPKFISSGSGSVMAYGVLETLYKEDMTLEEAKDLAIKCVNAAISRDSASGNGIEIFAVTKAGAERILSQDLDTRIKA